MSQALSEENLIRNYFLGELAEFEQDRVQERLLTDETFFETSLIIEEELMDDYAFGLLSTHDRQRLESGLLMSPNQHRRLQFTKLLEHFILKSENEFGPEAEQSNTELRAVSGESRYDDSWIRLLSEAQTNRNLLFSLFNNDWLGLRVLGRIYESTPVYKGELATEFGVPHNTLTATLGLLAESGLIEQQENALWCSSLGAEMVQKTEAMCNLQTS